MTWRSLKVALVCSRKHRNERRALTSPSTLATTLVTKATKCFCCSSLHWNNGPWQTNYSGIYKWVKYVVWIVKSSSSVYHCSFCDGPKAVDENIAGDVHRRSWGKVKTELLTHRCPQNSYTAVQWVHTPNETKSIRNASSDLKSFVPQFFQLLLWNLAKTRENTPQFWKTSKFRKFMLLMFSNSSMCLCAVDELFRNEN